MTRRRPQREIFAVTVPSYPFFLMAQTDASPGSFDVETNDASQHRPIRRCDCRPSPNCVGVDASRRLGGLHQIEPAPGSGRSCEPLFVLPQHVASNFLVGRHRKGPRLHPLSWRDTWRSEGGECLNTPLNDSPHSRCTAEHPCG